MITRSHLYLATLMVTAALLALPATALASGGPSAYTLRYSAASSLGSIDGSATQSVPCGSDGTTVTAVPRAGYHFEEWSDGLEVAQRCERAVSSDRSVVASFEKNPVVATALKLSVPSQTTVNRTVEIKGAVSRPGAVGCVTVVTARLVGGNWKTVSTRKVSLTRAAYASKFTPGAMGRWRIVVDYSGGMSATTTFKPSSTTRFVTVDNGMYFPLVGRFTWSDGFGAPRSGHTHQGQDLAAANGTPVRATVSGYVSSQTSGSAGKWITLRGSKYTIWYMHLSRFAVRKGRVKAGQIIGYVGCTGNAGPGNYHLHFEIHPGGGHAVNARRYLLGMRR